MCGVPFETERVSVIDLMDSFDEGEGGSEAELDIERISGRGGRVIPRASELTDDGVLELGRRYARRLAGAELDGEREGAWVALYPGGYKAGRCRGGGLQGGGGVRGQITRFSQAARRRFRERMLEFDFRDAISERRVLWVTFTVRHGRPDEMKRWLSNWRRRLMRRNPRAWYVWRMEYQGRGVPHFHLIVVFPTHSAAVLEQDLMVSDWCEVAGRLSCWRGELGDFPNAMPQGQRVKLVRGLWGLASYISDASKTQQATVPDPFFAVDSDGVCERVDSLPGRWWGVRAAYIGTGDDRRPVYVCMLVVPVMVYGWQVYYDGLRHAGALRRARYKQFDKVWRGPPGAVRDSVTFCDTSQLFKLSGVFRGDRSDTRPDPEWWRQGV